MRKTFRVLAWSLSVVALVTLAAGLLLPGWAKHRLAANGLGDPDFTVESLSPHHLSLSNISFGRGREQRLQRLTLLFRPARLLHGHPLDKVLIEGADLSFVFQDSGIPRLTGLSLPTTSETTGLEMPVLPTASIELRTSRLRLETGPGTLHVPLSGTLARADTGDWKLVAQLKPHYQEVRGELALEARLEQDRSGRLSATGDLQAYLAGSQVRLGIRATQAEDAGSALDFALDLDALGLNPATLDKAAGFGTGLDGRVSLQARLKGTWPIGSEHPLEQASAHGKVFLQLTGLALPGRLAETSGRLDADLSLAGASLLAVLAAPWEINGHLIGRDPPMRFRVSGVEGHALTLASSIDLEHHSAAGTLTFTLQGPTQSKLAGTVSSHIEHTAKSQDGPGFELDRLRLDPTIWVQNGIEIHLRALDAQLAGTASRIQGRISTRLDLAEANQGGNRLTGGAIELRGHLKQEDGSWVLAADDCIAIKVRHLELGSIRLLRPIALCARQAAGRPLAHLDAGGIASLALTLPGRPVVLAVTGGQQPVKLIGTLPQADLSATWDPTTRAIDLKLDTQGGHLTFDQPAVAVSDLALSLHQGQTTSVHMKRALVESLATPRELPALTLTGKADGRWDGAMTFGLGARGHQVPLKLSARGRHDFGVAIGELSYQLDRIRFSPRGLQPGDLVPALGGLVEKAQGSLAVSGGLSWVSGVSTSHVRLALHDLGFEAPGVSIRGMNTRIEHAGRMVRSRLGTQEIRIDLMDIGVPLRQGLIRFHTENMPPLRIEKLRFAWGGGRVQAEPLMLRLDRPEAEHPVVLTFRDIALNDLLRLIPTEGLQGTGTLSGRIPLRIRGSQVRVDQGSIRAQAPGVLYYRPRTKPAFFTQNSQTELLLEALRNFHYTDLSITLNGRTQDHLRLSITLAGANPDLYDGHPFKLNFNIDGELDTIAQRSLSIVTFAERFGAFLSRYFH